MNHITFNKTLCGVHLHLNVLALQAENKVKLNSEIGTADFFQIFFLKKANGFLKLNGCKIKLRPNTVVFISKNQHHSWEVDFQNFEGQLLLFQDEFLNDFFSDQYFIFRLLYFYQTELPLFLDCSSALMNEYLDKLREIKIELVDAKTDSAHIIRSLLYYILIQLNRKYSNFNAIKSAISSDNQAYQFRKLVEDQIHNLQRVDDYADLMNISRISLNKVVKHQFNVTATEFIKSRLLFEVKMNLIHTDKTVAEIANLFNFSEANHLTRFFKQKTGLSPIKFRQENSV